MDGMDGMSGMDTGSGNTTMTMQSIFQNSIATPLYSKSWTPTSTGAYAGTCIFLIILAVLLRGLLAAKNYLEAKWLDRELKRRYVVVPGKLPLSQRASQDTLAKRVTLTENGVEEDVFVVGTKKPTVRPWRLSVDPLRAFVDMVIAGVGYLLYVFLLWFVGLVIRVC